MERDESSCRSPDWTWFPDPIPVATGASASAMRRRPASLPVLMLRLQGDGPQRQAPAQCDSLRRNCRAYCIDERGAETLDDLLPHGLTLVPRVLIVDTRLVAPATVADLRHLRRRLPATEWVLGRDRPRPEDHVLAIRSHASGCIDWGLSPEPLTRMLDAVVAGELCFPLDLLEAMYLSQIGREDSHPEADNATLTAREAEVFALMRHGMTNKQIARQLEISANTVKKHLANIFEKRGLRSRRQECKGATPGASRFSS